MSRRTMILFAVGVILLIASLFSLKIELTQTDKTKEPEELEPEELEPEKPEPKPKPAETKTDDNGTV